MNGTLHFFMHQGCSFGSYLCESIIGVGGFSTVYRARHARSTVRIAIKVINHNQLVDDLQHARLTHEISILTEMNHPFIAKLLFVSQKNDRVEIGQELATHGSFVEFLTQAGELPEAQLRYYFAQFVSVLEYLHNDRKVAHRDLKLENILLDSYDNIKIIDFGLSREFESPNELFDTPCGSRPYISPELIATGRQGLPADIWSLGIILYACATARLPFFHENVELLYRQILSSDIHYPMHLSEGLTDLLQKMLCRDPNRRITLVQIKEHPWFPIEEFATVERAIREASLELGANDSETIALMAAGGIQCHGITMGEQSEISVLYNACSCQIQCERMNRALRERQMGEPLVPQSSMPILPPMCPGKPIRRESCPGKERASVIRRPVWPEERQRPFVVVQRRLRRPTIPPLVDRIEMSRMILFDRIEREA